jgi:hypothetical protein
MKLLKLFKQVLFEAYFSAVLPDEDKMRKAVYHGRYVTWYGFPEQMIVIHKDQVEGMWGNIYNDEKMEYLTNMIIDHPDKVELECSYGFGSVIDIQDIIEHQESVHEDSFRTDYDGIDTPYTTGDDELDKYLGNEYYISDMYQPDEEDFFTENRFAIIRNKKSVDGLKQELERLGPTEEDMEAFNEFINLETTAKNIIENKDGDIGKFMVQLRDGHHRVMSAIDAGEEYVCVNLAKDDIEKFDGFYKLVRYL